MDDAKPDDISRASETPATDDLASRREAMLKLAKGAAYVAPATLGYLATTRSAAPTSRRAARPVDEDWQRSRIILASPSAHAGSRPADDAAPASRFRFRIVDDIMAVINLSTRELHVLNALAAELWLELHDAPTELAAIAALWAERYGIDPATALADARACIEPWAAAGWIGIDSLGRVFIDRAQEPPPMLAATGATRPAADMSHRRLDGPGAAVDLGFGVTEASAGPSLMARAAGLFSGIPERAPEDPRQATEVALVLDGERHLVGENDRWMAFDDPQAALGALIRAVYRAAYPDDPAFVMLHAAALVAPGSHDLTVFPGISGAGKSTLTAFLVARGWGYATDDFIALTRPVAGRGPELLPMPNAVSIKEGSLALLAPLYPDLKALPPVTYGGKTARFLPIDRAAHVAAPLPARRLVFSRYVTGAATRLDPLPKGAALLGLVEASFSAESEEDSVGFEPLFDWLERTATFSLVYDDLEEARRCLQALTDTPACAR